VPIPEGVPPGAIAVHLGQVSVPGLAAAEYLDRACAAALSEGRAAPWPDGTALLLLEIEGSSGAETEARLATLESALGGVGLAAPAAVIDDAEELWTLRGESSIVLDERVGQRIREDVAVPLAAVDRLVRELERIAARERVRLYLFAHLGEGSLHPNYVVDPASPAAARIRAAVLGASVRLGGTISAEHGIGRLKVPYLVDEVGDAGIRVLRAVKAACDPDGILNPGKIYPDPAPPRGARGSARSPSGAGGRGARRP